MWLVELTREGELRLGEAWPVVDGDAPFYGPGLRPSGRWLADPRWRGADVGLIVPPDVDLDAIAATLPPVVAIEFPSFGDGRGYSVARRLRDHYGYRGRLWAVGDVLLDQLHLIARVGFDGFVMNERPDLRVVRRALSRYQAVYQAAADGRLPVWALRRRSRAA